jgi:hypothetical protein
MRRGLMLVPFAAGTREISRFWGPEKQKSGGVEPRRSVVSVGTALTLTGRGHRRVKGASFESLWKSARFERDLRFGLNPEFGPGGIAASDGDVQRRFDAQLDPVSPNVDHPHADVAADDQFFVIASRNDQHAAPP